MVCAVGSQGNLGEPPVDLGERRLLVTPEGLVIRLAIQLASLLLLCPVDVVSSRYHCQVTLLVGAGMTTRASH